jgi:selenide,water dikinase
MALASNVTLEITVGSVRFLPGALESARRGAIPGGLKNNRDFASCSVETSGAGDAEELLYDPQTSGGLLITLSETDAESLVASLDGAYTIGRVLPRLEKPIRLI